MPRSSATVIRAAAAAATRPGTTSTWTSPSMIVVPSALLTAQRSRAGVATMKATAEPIASAVRARPLR